MTSKDAVGYDQKASAARKQRWIDYVGFFTANPGLNMSLCTIQTKEMAKKKKQQRHQRMLGKMRSHGWCIRYSCSWESLCYGHGTQPSKQPPPPPFLHGCSTPANSSLSFPSSGTCFWPPHHISSDDSSRTVGSSCISNRPSSPARPSPIWALCSS